MTKNKAVNQLEFMCERKKALRKAFVCTVQRIGTLIWALGRCQERDFMTRQQYSTETT